MRDLTLILHIADDASPIHKPLLRMLTALHCAVRAAPDSCTVLAEIRREVPDIILTELNVPARSGFDLLSVVRCRLTSTTGDRYGQRFSRLGRAASYPREAHPGLLLQIIGDIMRPGRIDFD
jgi:PleD family two-component response regulator